MTRFARFQRADGRVVLGRVEGESLQPIAGGLFGGLRAEGARVSLESVRIVAPLDPPQVVAVAANYRDHAAEMGRPVPESPRLFLKPITAVIGPDEPILLPPGTERVDHEAELAVVVGRRVSRVPVDEALDVVFGYCCANDVTARDFQRADRLFARAKGFDTFCPLGPWIETDIDPTDLGVRCKVDGELRQDGRTSDMVFGVAELIAFVSNVMTLLPGTVILTGTPAGVGPLGPHRVVEVSIDGIGALANPVRDRDDRNPDA